MRKAEEFEINLSDDSADRAKPLKKEKLNVFDVFAAIVSALIAATIIFMFLFRVFRVEGPSMKPTLEPKDRVIVSTVGYKPKQGDIVVLSNTTGLKEPIVKRIIAVGGDEVDINFTTGVVTVNGSEEHYSEELTTQQADIAFPITVPEGTVFVLGDNRGMSTDSRSRNVGCVDERLIVGKVLGRFFPIGDWKVE